MPHSNPKASEQDRARKRVAALNDRLQRANDQIELYERSVDIRLLRFLRRLWGRLRKRLGFLGRFRRRTTTLPVEGRWPLPTPGISASPLPGLATISIVVFGPLEKLDAAVRSAVAQNYPRDKFDVLVLLDHSVAQNGLDSHPWLQHPQVRILPVDGNRHRRVADALSTASRHTLAEWVTPLHSTDELEPLFLETLASQATPTADLIIGPVSPFDAKMEDLARNTPVHELLESRPTLRVRKPEEAMILFETGLGRLYRTVTIEGLCSPIPDDAPMDLGVAEWALCAHTMIGEVALVRPRALATYRAWSFDGPEDEDLEKDAVDLIADLERIEEVVFDRNLPYTAKTFAIQAAKSLNRRLVNALERIDDEAREPIRDRILATDSPLINKSPVSERHALAICQAFPPYSNASSIVASQRLKEIEALEGEPLNWRVVMADMADRFPKDLRYRRLYSDFNTTRVDMVAELRGWNETLQLKWGQQAAAYVEDIPAEIMYSRSMQPGSHVAAYKYKRMHPDVKWYAEFSDPIYMDHTGFPRTVARKYTGDLALLNDFWLRLELLVYEHADVIIFTNHHQMPYMLDSSCPPEWREMVEAKSRVMIHPQLDERFLNVDPPEYELDPNQWNIGYFGTFYEGPVTDDTVGRVLSHPKVHLHLFTKTGPHVERLVQRYPGRISVNKPLPYMRFLNLSSRMDYLLLLHLPFPAEKDPYLRSKRSDYELSGVPIVSDTPANSPLLNLPSSKDYISVDRFLAQVAARDSELLDRAGLEKAQRRDTPTKRDVELARLQEILQARVERAEAQAQRLRRYPLPFLHTATAAVRNELIGTGRTVARKVRKVFTRPPQSVRPEALPGVTAVIATYRPVPYIDEAVRSMLDQEYPAERLRVLISVNGTDYDYLAWLREKYRDEPRVRVIHTEKQGIGPADNHAVRELETEWFLKLDDDDLLSPRYVAELAQHVAPDVDLVLGRLEDMTEDGSSFVRKTYITRTIDAAAKKAGENLPYFDSAIASHFSALTAKLMRTSAFQHRFGPRAEDVTHAGDVVFWIENAHLIEGRIAISDANSPEAYYRRLTDASVSRPDDERAYPQAVTNRLMMIDRFSKQIIDSDRSYEHRRFVAQRIVTQNRFMHEFFADSDDETKERIRAEIAATDNPLVARGWFGRNNGFIIAGTDDSDGSFSVPGCIGRIMDLNRELPEPIAWKLFAYTLWPNTWKDISLGTFLLPFAVQAHSVVTLPKVEPEGGYEPYISSQILREDPPAIVATMGEGIDFHTPAKQIKLVSPSTEWILVLPGNASASAQRDAWVGLMSAADTVVVSSEQQKEAVLKALPAADAPRVLVVEAKGLPEWYTSLMRWALPGRVIRYVRRRNLLSWFGWVYRKARRVLSR